jgi:hypothetical protein
MKQQQDESVDTLPGKEGGDAFTSRGELSPIPDQNLARSEFCTFEDMPKYIFRQ